MVKFPRPPTLVIRTQRDPLLLEGIIAECDALGWRVIDLTYLNDNIALEEKPIGAIIERERPGHTIERMRRMGVPIVRIWSAIQAGFRCDACLAEDRREGGRLAADAFAERGFKEFGFVTFAGRATTDELFQGFQEQAETVHNVSVHVCNFAKTNKRELRSYERFVEEVSAWLKERPKPLAMLAINLRRAIRVLAACERAGLSVPEQVAVACRGNDDAACRTSFVPMSAIDMNHQEIGRQAVQTVQRLVGGEDPSDEIIHVPVKGFVERRSTDILAVSDPVVAKAMRFMWDHIGWPLSVDDVALEVNTSRATLERMFRRTLERGIKGELRRKRLEVCKEMLRTTKTPLSEIAKSVGLNSTRHLHRSFKNAFGMTPHEYRRSH